MVESDIYQEVQARVTVIDDAIKDFMLKNPDEGIKIQLYNPLQKLVLDQVVKPEELITYKSKQSKDSFSLNQ